MNKEQIIEMAEKAGCDVSAMDGREYQTMWCDIDQLERFAELIAAAEREECALIAEKFEYVGYASQMIRARRHK